LLLAFVVFRHAAALGLAGQLAAALRQSCGASQSLCSLSWQRRSALT